MTEFGKFLRIVRVKNEESARKMAEKLYISPSYLSSIENGSRRIPTDFIERIADVYKLSDEDNEKLRETLRREKLTETH
ncbi:MAG: helix-turn-helix domain-containing protein [Clostridia bacterium]|nr:helix-turn-helix domain-containing protein [Clostridia bacterium]